MENLHGKTLDKTSLKEAPVLPATKLAEECYYLMFYLCHSLEAAPELPSDELAINCYAGMFFECLSLESAPYLPAEKLVFGCYDSIFRDCPNLKSIKVAFTDWADGTATPDWVSGVAAEGNFECPESLEVKYGKDYVPTGWRVNGATTRDTVRDLHVYASSNGRNCETLQ